MSEPLNLSSVDGGAVPQVTPMQAAAAANALSNIAKPIEDFIASKPWHQSLTVQGAMMAAAASAISAYAPGVFSAFGLSPDLSSEITHVATGVFALAGSVMALVGRLRLGGLK